MCHYNICRNIYIITYFFKITIRKCCQIHKAAIISNFSSSIQNDTAMMRYTTSIPKSI